MCDVEWILGICQTLLRTGMLAILESWSSQLALLESWCPQLKRNEEDGKFGKCLDDVGVLW